MEATYMLRYLEKVMMRCLQEQRLPRKHGETAALFRARFVKLKRRGAASLQRALSACRFDGRISCRGFE